MAYDLRPLKRVVRDTYPPEHPLQVISDEEDIIEDTMTLLGKAEVWLRLSHL